MYSQTIFFSVRSHTAQENLFSNCLTILLQGILSFHLMLLLPLPINARIFNDCQSEKNSFRDKLQRFNEMISPCFAGQRDEVKNTSGRIVILMSYMMSVVLLAAYSAFLISSLAVQPRDLPFRDLQGLVHEGSYKLGVVDGTSTINIFDV